MNDNSYIDSDEPYDFENLDCDDSHLIDAARDGEPAAFRRLVDCNQGKLFASMFQLLNCHQDAEEAVQEAFIRAFTRIDTFNNDSKFSTWLYSIAFNSAISSRRKRRPRLSLDKHFEEHGMDICDEDGEQADASALRAEETELLQQAMDSLSDDHRAILVLRVMDDLAYEEIAEVLGVSMGTVRSRLSRARGRLREAVEALQPSIAF